MTEQQPELTLSESQTATPATSTPPPKRNLWVPIILMVWPLVAVATSIILYAIVNFFFGINQSSSDVSFDASNPLRAIINVILFIVGAGAVLLGPISFVVGLILLITRLQKK